MLLISTDEMVDRKLVGIEKKLHKEMKLNYIIVSSVWPNIAETNVKKLL